MRAWAGKIKLFEEVLVVAAIGCGRRDDGSISAEPEQKVQPGIPTIFMAPKSERRSPGAPARNPLAMPLKHDGPAQAAAAASAASLPVDPCAPKDPGRKILAMRLRPLASN